MTLLVVAFAWAAFGVFLMVTGQYKEPLADVAYFTVAVVLAVFRLAKRKKRRDS